MLNRQEYPSLRQSLVGAWCPSLGASGYTLLDRSGCNQNGTLSGVAAGTAWPAIRGGLSLYGSTSALVSVPTTDALNPDRTDAFSVAGWALIPTVGSNQTIVGNLEPSGSGFRGWEFQIDGAGSLLVLVVGTYSSSTIHVNSPTGAIAANALYHVAATYDGSSSAAGVSLYVNGIRQTNTVVYNTLTTTTKSTQPIRFFQRAAGGNQFTGYADDLRFYRRVLKLAEIRLLASRRGIGLSPLPYRTAGMPRKLYVNVGGTWRSGDAYVNTGSGWRLGIPSVNVGGTWK